MKTVTYMSILMTAKNKASPQSLLISIHASSDVLRCVLCSDVLCISAVHDIQISCVPAPENKAYYIIYQYMFLLQTEKRLK